MGNEEKEVTNEQKKTFGQRMRRAGRLAYNAFYAFCFFVFILICIAAGLYVRDHASSGIRRVAIALLASPEDIQAVFQEPTYAPAPTVAPSLQVPPAPTATPVPPAPTATPAPPPPPPPAPTTAPPAETFAYVPGGPNYAYPEDGAVEQVGDGWTRIRRAANGQYLPWTFLIRIRCDREIGERLQWDSATKLNIFGSIRCKIELKRDLESSRTIQPDPYEVANAKNSPLGLGWFLEGIGAVTVNNGTPVQLTGPGVKQFGFPPNWSGTWNIYVEVPANGLLVFNQGEKLVPEDNWPLP